MRQNDSQLENHQHSQEIDCFPNSKKKDIQKKGHIFYKFPFSLHQVY